LENPSIFSGAFRRRLHFLRFSRNPLAEMAGEARMFARGAGPFMATSCRFWFDRTANDETCRRENFLWKNG